MKSLTIVAFFIFVFVGGFSNLNLIRSVKADSPFDSYKNISWKEETAHLDNFATYLHNNPEMIGYVVFSVGEKDSIRKVKNRINRAKNYLIKFRKVAKSRIIIIEGERLDESVTYLQPVERNLPKPNFNNRN